MSDAGVVAEATEEREREGEVTRSAPQITGAASESAMSRVLGSVEFEALQKL